MKSGVSTLERAFELARSGRVGTIVEIIAALGKEGYTVWDLDGPAVRKQLREIIAENRKSSKPPA